MNDLVIGLCGAFAILIIAYIFATNQAKEDRQSYN